jgi:hypothetical protein
MLKRTHFIMVLVLLLSACNLTQTDVTWDIISDGKGTWNIDELRITHLYSGTVTTDTTLYNHGTVTFSGTKKASEYAFEKSIPLKTFTLGPIAGPLDVFSTDLYFDLNTGGGLSKNFIDAQIIKIEKKEIILFCPWTLNTIFDGIEDVDFYLKLSKK